MNRKKFLLTFVLVLTLMTCAIFPILKINKVFADDVQDDPAVIKNFRIDSLTAFYEFADYVNSGESTEQVTAELLTTLNFNLGEFTSQGEYLPVDDETLVEYTPIGLEYPFKGIFEGNNYDINGIYCKGEYAGLFAKTELATIRNLTIGSSYIEGTKYAGAVSGYSYGTIFENITVNQENSYINSQENVGVIYGINETIKEISNIEDLKALARSVNNGEKTSLGLTYVLTNDIVINENNFSSSGDFATLETFIPIGNEKYPFKAKFDGQGYKISGLYLNQDDLVSETGNIPCGLFGAIEDAEITNITFNNCYATGDNELGILAGIVTGSQIGSKISNITAINCYIKGYQEIGGLIGKLKSQETTIKNSSIIKDCYFSGEISGIGKVGGIIGSVENYQLDLTEEKYHNLTNLSFYGKIETQGKIDKLTSVYNFSVGGIIGYSYACKVENCTNNGNIYIKEFEKNSQGEILGVQPITNRIGGIVGESYRTNFYKCRNNKNIKGSKNIGGICGEIQISTIDDCSNYGTITGIEYVGGLVGKDDLSVYNSVIKNSVNNGDIYGTRYVGGIAGICNIVENSSSYNKIFVIEGLSYSKAQNSDGNDKTQDGEYLYIEKTDLNAYSIGGLVGELVYYIDNSYSETTIETGNEFSTQNIGGLVGSIQTNSYNKHIINSYASGIINVNAENVGGLVGYLMSDIDLESYVSLLNSYSVVEITQNGIITNCGGLVGYIKSSIINNCFSVREIEANSNYGSLVGKIEGNNTITNCYYPDHFKHKAINNVDDIENNCIGLPYGKFNVKEDGLVTLLNNVANTKNEYNIWTNGSEYPEHYIVLCYVKYDFNGGKGSIVDYTKYEIGQTVVIDFSVLPQKDKYTFKGYILNGDTETLYTIDNNSFIISSIENVLTALWEENEILYIESTDEEFDYDSNYHTIALTGYEIGDIVLYSEDGITYSNEVLQYKLPGEYKIFYKIQRENYFDYISYGTLKINKISINFNEIKWQREWFIDSLSTYQTEFIENEKFTYNSYENKVNINSTTIPFDTTVEYFVNGQKVDYLTCKNAGNYSITAVFNFDKTIYDNTQSNFTYNFVIEKYKLVKPIGSEEKSFTYNNSQITYKITNDSDSRFAIDITGDKNVNTGNYIARCSIKDKVNFEWADGTNEDVTFNYEITKQLVEIPNVTVTKYTYDKQEHKLIFDTNTDIVHILNNNYQANVGSYEVMVTLIDKENYEFVDHSTTKTYTMEITPKLISKPTINKNIFDYDGKQKSLNVTNTDSYKVLNNSGIFAGEYQTIISLIDKNNTMWADSLDCDDYIINFTINKKEIEVPVNTKEYTYNGLEQKLDIDTSSYYEIINNLRTNAGEQDVTVVLYDKANTCWKTTKSTDDLKIKFLIKEARLQTVSRDELRANIINDKIVTNINELTNSGVKIEYSLDNENFYEELKIEDDGEYKVYYRISLPNYKTQTGTFNIIRNIDKENKSSLGAVGIFIIIMFVIAGGIGFILYCYVNKKLFFKQKEEVLPEKKKLSFEENQDTTKQEDKTNKSTKPKKMVAGQLEEDLNKAKEAYNKKMETQRKIKEQRDSELEEESKVEKTNEEEQTINQDQEIEKLNNIDKDNKTTNNDSQKQESEELNEESIKENKVEDTIKSDKAEDYNKLDNSLNGTKEKENKKGKKISIGQAIKTKISKSKEAKQPDNVSVVVNPYDEDDEM